MVYAKKKKENTIRDNEKMPHVVDLKQISGEKEKSIEEKKFAHVANFFCGHAYSIDLIGRIFSTSEWRRKKSHQLDESTYSRKMSCEEKKDKTVSFQSTNKKSILKLCSTFPHIHEKRYTSFASF